MTRAIEAGSRVTLDFTITLENDIVAETTANDEPLVFVVGGGELDPGLEQHLLGLEEGQQATLELQPGEAFGDPDPGNVHVMARSEFPDDMMLGEGQVIEFTTPGGDPVPGTVMELMEDTVLVDFNHPLAGRALTIWVDVIEIGDGHGPG